MTQQINPGDMFHFWRVVEQSKDSKSYYICLCTGCNGVEKTIRKWNLLSGKTKSCGCKKVEEMKKTCQDKFGTAFSQQNTEVKQKSKNTLEEKYGVDNYSKTVEHKRKCKAKSQEKWGTDHHTQSEKWRNRSKPKYGVAVLGKTILGKNF
jgi:hypothetical protein